MKIFILTILAASLLPGQKSADGVKAAEKAWAAATTSNDKAALDKVLANDLNYIHSTGDVDTKKTYVDNLSNGVRVYNKIEHEEPMDIRLYGNTAVVSASGRFEVTSRGNRSPAHLRFLHVWVYQQGRWQLAAHQSLRLPN
ncbi:MAG: nuclear transport factor 2 family protein [Bryobacteraceae bacterium]